MLTPTSWLYGLSQGTLLVKLKSFTRLYSNEVLVTFQDERDLKHIWSGVFLLALQNSALVLKRQFFESSNFKLFYEEINALGGQSSTD